MKKILIVPFMLFSLAAASSWSYANEAKIPQGSELSTHRHADRPPRQQVHNHDHKPKNKYDLRYVDGGRGGHVHPHNKKGSLRHDHTTGHSHEHGGEQEHGDGHQNHRLDGSHHHQGPRHRGHQGPDPHGHGHEQEHSDHRHRHEIYDRLWDVGISG